MCLPFRFVGRGWAVYRPTQDGELNRGDGELRSVVELVSRHLQAEVADVNVSLGLTVGASNHVERDAFLDAESVVGGVAGEGEGSDVRESEHFRCPFVVRCVALTIHVSAGRVKDLSEISDYFFLSHK